MSSDYLSGHQAVNSGERVTVIERKSGWRAFDFKELWTYRELLGVLIQRDIKVRYKQTVMGIAWAVLQPLAAMLLFSLVFGRFAGIPSDGYPYPIFVYAALLPWTFFAASINGSSSSLIGQQQLISKVYFPRLIIPLSSVGAALVDFAVASVMMMFLMVYFDVEWTSNIFAVPLLICAVILVALGVGTLLAALTVTYRDFRYVVPFMVQFWMWATPIVYPTSMFPEKWQWLLYVNPMTGLIEGFRAAFLGHSFDLLGISTSVAFGLLLFILGVAYFAKVERRFADII